MSTTAGVGLAEYRAVSGLAVASLLCSLAGVATVVSWIFVALPVIGVLLGLVALWQIARANGTLVGRAPAILGVVLGLLIAGYFGWQGWSTRTEDAAFRASIAKQIEEFGAAMAAEDYVTAHGFLAPTLREESTPQTLASVASTYTRMRLDGELLYGPIRGAKPSGRTMIVRDGDRAAAASEMTLLFEKGTDDAQRIELIRDADGRWRISRFDRWNL